VKNSLLQLAFGLAVLILGAAAEELLPKVLGVGFPVVLASVPVLAAGRGSILTRLVLAVVAGALEDALSGLPVMTSVSYFLAVTFLVDRLDCSRILVPLAYPCYQLWLAVWSDVTGGGVFTRLFLSVPVGAVTAMAAGWLIAKARKGAAVDEQD